MKKLLITAFVLAANSTAFAGEYYGDDTLGWISDYQSHHTGYFVLNHAAPANSDIAEYYDSEYYGDPTLAGIDTASQSHFALAPVSPSPAISHVAEYYDSEYYGDPVLAGIDEPSHANFASNQLSQPPAVGSSKPSGILEQ